MVVVEQAWCFWSAEGCEDNGAVQGERAVEVEIPRIQLK